MRHTLTTLALAGAMAGATGAAGAPGRDAAVTLQTAAPHKATHAVRGIVTARDAHSLAIRQSGSHPHTFVFVLDSATLHDGSLVVGATVSVRYYVEGHALIATAVTVNR